MKIVLAIISNDDAPKVCSALTNSGHFVTKLSTTGGFLRVGNTTILVGTEEQEVPNIKQIIAEHISPKKDMPSFERGLVVNDASEEKMKGATVFVLDVAQFEKM